MTSDDCDQKARRRCRSRTLSRQTDPWNPGRSSPARRAEPSFASMSKEIERYSYPEETALSVADMSTLIKLKVTRDTPRTAEPKRTAMMNVGARLVKTLASKTTTETVLASAIFQVGRKEVAAGMNLMNMKRSMDKAAKVALEDLAAQATMISKTSTVHSIVGLIGSTAPSSHADRFKSTRGARWSRHKPTDARGVAEDQLVQAQQTKAELGLGCKEAALR